MSKIDELRDTYSTAYQTKLDSYDYDEAALNCIAEAERAGIGAVVRAVRDEFENELGKCLDCSASGVHDHIDEGFNQILGAAGEEVAGAERVEKPTSAVAQAETPATDPAPAVCVWGPRGIFHGARVHVAACDGGVRATHGVTRCPSCGKPIKFTEAKT